jgi:hypothetical protein
MPAHNTPVAVAAATRVSGRPVPHARRTPRRHCAPTEQAHAARLIPAVRCPDRRPNTAPDGDRAPTAGRATRHQVVARMTARRSGPRAPRSRATPTLTLAELHPLRSADVTSDRGTLTKLGSAAMRPHDPPPAHDTPVALTAATRVRPRRAGIARCSPKPDREHHTASMYCCSPAPCTMPWSSPRTMMTKTTPTRTRRDVGASRIRKP